MMFISLEAHLQAKLQCAWSMRIERVQEGSAGYAVGPAPGLKSSRVFGSGIAAHDVVSAAARVVRVVYAELRVIKNVEGFRAKLDVGGFIHLEVLRQRHVKIQSVRIVQVIAASISKSESTGRDKLGGVADKRAKALAVIARLGQ